MREHSEVTEIGILCKSAALSRDARRAKKEERCPIRTEFQRDRDRIIHSNAFRRLKGKTQVFLAPIGDHYRNRLTHTLEVSQIARTVARALRLNEDLTEAIALAHDLGHTPFGHSGEHVLNDISSSGFCHYIQSVRVAEYIEKGGKGLNLTLEVKNGIATHSGKTPLPLTKEGQVVRLCDKIAYINHDIEDAVRAGVLFEKDLPSDCVKILGETKSARITTMVSSIVENGVEEIKMSPEIKSAHDKLRTFLFDCVYENSAAKAEESKAKHLVEVLYNHYLAHPETMTPEYIIIAETRGIERAVIDYISGMTDRYAMDSFNNLFVPRVWAG
ncbi:MAG: deoxyguanosinetriphosphate triphosphohydrolase [Ruminococcus sp.]|jgi:dGTPase|nr:deoxyguanosinetriphosphate triphosphohydrolase [Ruminococcus sp.]